MTIKNHQEVEDMALAAFFQAAEKNGTIYSLNTTESAIRGAVQCAFSVLNLMDDKDIVEFVRKGK